MVQALDLALARGHPVCSTARIITQDIRLLMEGVRTPEGPLITDSSLRTVLPEDFLVSGESIIEKEQSIFPEVVCALERAQALESDGPDLYCVILGSHLTSLSLSFAVAGYQYQPHRISLEQRSFLY